MANVWFDTCVYHQPGIDLLVDVVPVDNILFASEMVGAVRGIDPETGHYYDDTRRYVDGADLSDADREKIFDGNVQAGLPPPPDRCNRRCGMTNRHVQSLSCGRSSARRCE